MATCCVNLKDTVITARLWRKKCGYCRADKRLPENDALAPKGLCVDAFYAVYPYLLALLYDANLKQAPFSQELIIRCPNSDNPALIKVAFRFKKTKIIFNFIENIARAIGFPKDAVDKIIMLEIMSAGGQCSLKADESFKINMPDINKVCPAAFFSMYPLINFGLQNLNLACPDPKTNIVYSMDFPGKVSADSLRVKSKPCDYLPDMSKYKIILTSHAECPMRNWQEKEIGLDKLRPSGICPFGLNIAVPYLLTLANGGHFKWRKDINTVQAQCPSCQGQAVFEIKRDKLDFKKLTLTFNKAAADCQYNYKQGQSYPFDFSKIICLHLFTRIFPSVLRLEYANSTGRHNNEQIIISCPFEEKKATYLLKNT